MAHVFTRLGDERRNVMNESDFAFLLANIFAAAGLSKTRHEWLLWALWALYMALFAMLIYNGS
jgi:hypothetical protein